MLGHRFGNIFGEYDRQSCDSDMGHRNWILVFPIDPSDKRGRIYLSPPTAQTEVPMPRLPASSFLAVAVLLWGVSAQIDDNSTEVPLEPNECDNLVPGNLYFTYLRSAEPDEVVLLPFDDIPGNMTLYLTDNAWTGSSFQSDEGTLEVSGQPGDDGFLVVKHLLFLGPTLDSSTCCLDFSS